MALDKEVSSQPFKGDFELTLCEEKLYENEKKIFSSISSLPNLFSFFFLYFFFDPSAFPIISRVVVLPK